MHIDDIIRSRRTHKTFAPCTLADSDLLDLLELGSWAPNHRQAEPWRYYVMNRHGIDQLDAFFAAHPAIASWPQAGKESKMEKLRQIQLPQLSAIIHVTSRASSSDLKDRENYAASSAAVQNILLAATARGYASFWNSSACMRHPDTQAWLGVDCAHEHFVGSLWLGGCPEQHPPSAPPRSVAECTHWITSP